MRNTPKRHAAFSALLSLVLLIIVLEIVHPWPALYALAFVALMVLTSSAAAAVVAAQGERSFGCVNGDIMGATNELSKSPVLLVGMLGVVLFLSML